MPGFFLPFFQGKAAGGAARGQGLRGRGGAASGMTRGAQASPAALEPPQKISSGATCGAPSPAAGAGSGSWSSFSFWIHSV